MSSMEYSVIAPNRVKSRICGAILNYNWLCLTT
jgi:hypothetical protein